MLAKNQNVGQKSKCWPKIKMLAKIEISEQISLTKLFSSRNNIIFPFFSLKFPIKKY